MAWIDDRIWCHPKIADLTSDAYKAFVNGIAYSSGFHTSGHLSEGQQRTIGATSRDRRELVDAGLWHLNGDGKSIDIHDWEEHNGARDARRAVDRARKKKDRDAARRASEEPQLG